MRLGATVPDFTAQTTHGPIRFYNWLGNSWCILFSHPADFTPVCTTELARMAERAYEFTKRGVRMIGHSCDSVAKHLVWLQDIRSFARNLPAEFPYPIIADETRELAVALDMLDESERTAEGEPVSVRAVLIIAPDRRLRLSMYYPNTTGRNVDEILRVIDSLMLTERLRVVTPVDWTMGDDLLVDTTSGPSLCGTVPRAAVPENRVETVQMPSGLAYVRKTKFYYDSSPSTCEFWDS
ncbi:peroxiredoxin-6-like isoform X2 [Schistocerca gregaria]|uniref:peroxiredoxin-6-like isoform X2 n=1 Tax=Schistocerca gregaria TaxID=7010 RepID=UPI00211E36CA|nr:peroxiredoxin-6-like isoform X2 [Schistocerca gregaria]